MNIDSIKYKVFTLLREDEECRNDDKYLYIKYLKKYHTNGKEFMPLGLLFECPDLAHISRVRRKIQENRVFIPTKLDVCLKRKISKKHWEKWSKS